MSEPFLIKLLKHIIIVFFFLNIVVPAYPGLIQDDTLTTEKITSEDLIVGERLFHGLVYIRNKSMKCTSCHNLIHSDTLNWNPDAIEISKKYREKNVDDLSGVLLKPTGVKMAEVHKDFKFTPGEIVLIKAYMDELSTKELRKEKPVVTNLLIFLLASILLILSSTDLIVTKKLKRQWINLAVITISGAVITWYMVVEAINLGHSPGYSPDQPVKFSHAVHAGQNKTDCVYCHSYAPLSKTSGFPATNVCMNCHLIVRTGKRSGAFEIAKVIDHFEKMVPFEWTRVHNLPDHVFFSHAQHVTAGGVKCQECHGPVQEMPRIKLANKMTMGWCINCHRTRNVNFRDNLFYSQYTDITERLNNGELTDVTVARIGGTECMKCHY